MDERIMQFRVGVVVLAVALIGAFLVLMFNHFPSFTKKTYTVKINYSEAPGVSAGTPVRRSGVLIGRVTRVELKENERPVRVEVMAAIDANHPLAHNEVLEITSVGLLGDAELTVVESRDKSLPDTDVKDGEQIPGIVAPNPIQAFSSMQGDLTSAVRSLDRAGVEVANLAHDLDKMVGGDNKQLSRLLAKTESSLDILQTTLTNVNNVVGDEQVRKQLKQSVAELPEVFNQMQKSLAMIQRISSLADDNLRNLSGLTKPLGERGEGIVNNVDQSVRRLDELLTQLSQFSQQLNGTQGSLGQLLHNPELYQQLTQAARNINAISISVRPIIDDARAFADKIARHPELLGVGGAVQRSSGIK